MYLLLTHSFTSLTFDPPAPPPACCLCISCTFFSPTIAKDHYKSETNQTTLHFLLVLLIDWPTEEPPGGSCFVRSLNAEIAAVCRPQSAVIQRTISHQRLPFESPFQLSFNQILKRFDRWRCPLPAHNRNRQLLKSNRIALQLPSM